MNDIKLIQNKLPVPSDFSERAVRKALLSHANNHWAVRYSIPLVLGSAVFGGLFGFSYPIFLSMLGFVGVGSVSWVYHQFIQSDKFKKKYVDELHAVIKKYTEEKRVGLKVDLMQFENDHAVKQLTLFETKFTTLVDILQTKFVPDQLTYSRYYAIAQEVYLSGIDNLSKILLAHKTLASIDEKYLEERLTILEKSDPNNKAVQKERDALLRSKNSFAEQQYKIQELLAENEVALNQLDEAAISIANIDRSKDEEAQIDMENSMKALSKLVEQSKYYSR